MDSTSAIFLAGVVCLVMMGLVLIGLVLGLLFIAPAHYQFDRIQYLWRERADDAELNDLIKELK